MIDEYIQFINKIYHLTKIDLNKYKRNQMERRLISLREKNGFSNFSDYYNQLTSNQYLLDEFIDKITINVSEFFRNPERWDVFEEIIINKLKEKKQLNIWSAACSSGQEPYTIAMILAKHIPLSNFKILATDIDEKILSKAKEGIYNKDLLKELPENQKNNYITHISDDLFTINAELKERITFKKENLLEDNFNNNFDFIICRNVMIYFTDEAKEKLYYKFANALNPGGYLFVGATEQIFNPHKYNFSNNKTFFYEKM